MTSPALPKLAPANPTPVQTRVESRASLRSEMRPVLLADDDPAQLARLDSALQECHLANPLLQARDGDEVITLLRERLGSPCALPVLVVLDGEMPGRSGLEVLAWMRGEPALRHTPVIILADHAARADVREAYDLGASSYLVKPVGLTALAAIVRALPAAWSLA